MSTPTLSASTPNVGAASASRLTSIDILRGTVMVIMALDHTRDFFSSAHFDPTDLARTTPLLFFTRWVTHFCAPVFVLLAGTAAYLSFEKGKERCELARFLVTRGLWLVFLEIAVVTPLGWSFNFDFSFTRLQVIWAIGASMVVLAGLILCFPPRAIAAFGVIMIVGHNLLDGPHVAWLGDFQPAWKTLHSLNFFEPFPHKIVASLYPLVPWVGVMALGYGAGRLAVGSPAQRKRVFLSVGLSMIALFALLRGTNLYGDPRPWTAQGNELYSLLPMFNCTKYPPSLAYLLMTLGPALCLLAFADSLPVVVMKPLELFGRVPLFYYLLHLPLIHGLAVMFSVLRYGHARWLLQDQMALQGSAHPLPAGYGYDLWVVYLGKRRAERASRR